MTRAGVVLGTAAYMSPEQARGVPVDKRTDIWAFGCVLFEMITGRVPFQGDTVADTIAAILTRGAGLERATQRHTGWRARAAPAMPGEGRQPPAERHR